ncbi:MAG: nitroreductase family protein [Nitrososphaeria archaeon]|nr:nitroreductase family protein [Nitrososphaeria archaeon]NIQ32360.1 nitroreductase family protein [Nitrososphaeria archaeon]
MDVMKAIMERRSIRSFVDKPISDEDAIKILNAGRWAPSGGNRQPWNFVYVNDPQTIRMIKNCSPGFYGDAPAAVVIGVESKVSSLDLLDVGFVAENMILAAQSLGIGSCPIASFIKDSIKMVIDAPEDWEPVLVISFGYIDKIPDPPKKKAYSEIVRLGTYDRRWENSEVR